MNRPGSSHIAVLVPALDGGGAERVALLLADAVAVSNAVTVITYKEPAKCPHNLGWSHIHIEAGPSGPLRLLVIAVKLSRIIRQHRFHAVLGVLTYSNLLLYLCRPFLTRHVRLVASEHAPLEAFADARLGRRIQRWLLPQVYSKLPLIVVSQAIADDFAGDSRFSRANVLVVRNPVDGALVRRRALEGAELVSSAEPHVVRVVTVARLDPAKGLDVLLEAMALLPPGYELTLIGSGPLQADLERQATALGVSGRVTFLGSQWNPYPWMAAADVVVLPSRWEGFGLVALEAAALNRPFIGTSVGGLGSVCRDLGYPTVPAGSPEALAEAIRTKRCLPNQAALVHYEVQAVAADYEKILLGGATPR